MDWTTPMVGAMPGAIMNVSFSTVYSHGYHYEKSIMQLVKSGGHSVVVKKMKHRC